MTKINYTPAKPRIASTVILARQSGEELQVYLLKRNAKSGFMTNSINNKHVQGGIGNE